MPIVLRCGGYRFFFFSLEGNEPPHVHVEQAGRYAKIWLDDPVLLDSSRGFRSREISDILEIAQQNRKLCLERWNEHFGRTT